MTYAKDDNEWQRLVLERCDGRCSWPGCNSTWELAGHHVIDRRYKALRLALENGVVLCGSHHSLLHTLGKLRERASILLVGSRTYSQLLEVTYSVSDEKSDTGAMPSSGDNQSCL